MKVSILDDYHDTLRTLPCFQKLKDHEVEIWNDHVQDVDTLAQRLKDTEALVMIRERVYIQAPVLDRLDKLRFISNLGPYPHIDVDAIPAEEFPLYHSWSYDLEGRLRGVPDSENFQNLDKSCLGLGAIRCETWAGLVFINFDRNAVPLREFLAPILRNMDEEIGDGAPQHQSRFVHKSVTPMRGNWKLGTDANIETYHVNTVHKDLSAVLHQKATTIWLLANGHSRMFNGQRYPIERNPAVPRLARVNPVTGEGVYAYLIYPNTVMVVSPTLIFTTQAWPLGPGESRYDAYYLMAEPNNERNRTSYERMIAATEKILKEDLGNLAFMQKSFEAGTIESIPLGFQERRIYYLHEMIDRSIGDELIPTRLRVPAMLEGFIEQ